MTGEKEDNEIRGPQPACHLTHRTKKTSKYFKNKASQKLSTRLQMMKNCKRKKKRHHREISGQQG
jgi:hypothetical protein